MIAISNGLATLEELKQERGVQVWDNAHSILFNDDTKALYCSKTPIWWIRLNWVDEWRDFVGELIAIP